jgi:hypothetical protein
MKKASIICFMLVAVFFGLVVSANAGSKSLTFLWNQNAADMPQLKEWRLFQADTATGPWTPFFTVTYNGVVLQDYTGTGNLTVPDGTEKTVYFSVTAVDKSNNESGRSNVVSALIDFLAPSVPVTLRVTVN